MEEVKKKLKEDSQSLQYVNTCLNQLKSALLEQKFDEALEYAKWLRDKTALIFGIEDNNLKIMNNYVYWAHLGINIGSEQGYNRPILVVHTTKESPVCAIIPFTLERLNDNIPYHIDLTNGKSTVLVEQLRVISKKRIYDYHYENRKYATIKEDDWKKINIQLEYLYRLRPLFVKNSVGTRNLETKNENTSCK